MRLIGHQPLEYTEAALIAIGLAICATAIVRVARRRAWGEAFGIAPLPATSFSALDLLGYFLITNLIGMLCLSLLAPRAPTTAPASSQPGQLIANAPANAAANCLVPISGAILILALVPSRVTGRFRGWGLDATSWRRAILPGLLYYLAIWPFCAGALILTRAIILRFAPDHQFDEHATLNLLHAGHAGHAWIPVALTLGAVIAAPLGEELFFRGMIQSMLQRVTPSAWLGALGAAVIFAAFHWNNPDTLPSMLIFGLALGVAFARTRSLAVPIIMHVCFNGKTILRLLLGAPV